MIDMEVTVVSFLENIDGMDEKVFRWWVPDKHSNLYPYIRVAELNNVDNDYADNQARTSDIDIQVDFWTKDDPSNLQNQIDQRMKSLNFKRTSVTSFREEDTGALRKALRYSTKVKIGE
jgi:hypothetical protein